jgi:hypothetical protein
MSNKVALPKKKVPPHGLQVVHKLVLGMEHIQQVPARFLVYRIHHILEAII